MNPNPAIPLDEEFEAKQNMVKNLKTRPKDEELLELYALYKQATEGDNNTAKPGFFSFKDQAKWNA